MVQKRAPPKRSSQKYCKFICSRHTACAAIPSPRPVKPRPSSVVALMLTQSRSRLQADANVAAHLIDVRAQLRTLCQNRRIDIFNPKALAAYPPPPPLRAALSCPHRRTAGHRPGKARRSPRASPRRAKHPLWHARARPHRMPQKALFIRDMHAAQNELSVFCKLVYVITVTDPHSNTPLLFRRKSLCHKQILRRCDLDVFVIARGQIYLAARRFNELAIVRILLSGVFRKAQRFFIQRKGGIPAASECTQSASLRRSAHRAVRRSNLDGVFHRHRHASPRRIFPRPRTRFRFPPA